MPAVPGCGTELSIDTLPEELLWGREGEWLPRARGETPGSTKPGPRLGCAVGFEGSGHRLQHSMGCAGVLGHRLDAQGRSKHHAKPC